MSRENVELMRRALEYFQTEGEFLVEVIAPDFVWDMSKFHGWPEQQLYEGVDEARRFIREWTEPFEDWGMDVEAIRDGRDDRVLVIIRQRGRARSTGMPVDMLLGQVYTIRDGRQTRMQMYSDPGEAMRDMGLEE